MPASRSISVTMPPAMVKDARRIAKRESRSVSAVIRDALRQYQQIHTMPEELTDEWILRFWTDAKASPMSDEESARERKRLARYGASRAKALGIKTDEDIVRIIHEYRAERRAQNRT